MKAYELKVLFIDHDGELDESSVASLIENNKYHSVIAPEVMSVRSKEIGPWTDDHPLNFTNLKKAEYERLFKDCSGKVYLIINETNRLISVEDKYEIFTDRERGLARLTELGWADDMSMGVTDEVGLMSLERVGDSTLCWVPVEVSK